MIEPTTEQLDELAPLVDGMNGLFTGLISRPRARARDYESRVFDDEREGGTKFYVEQVNHCRSSAVIQCMPTHPEHFQYMQHARVNRERLEFLRARERFMAI